MGFSRMRHRMRLGMHKESGQATLELALLLPVLLILLFGIVDLSKAFNYWNDQNDLANRGARYAAVVSNPGKPGSLANYIKSRADTTDLQSRITVCINPAVAGAQSRGDAVKVTVTSSYDWLPLVKAATGSAVKTVTGTAEMRLERNLSDGDPGVLGCST
jgi:Flp pilus assembly protein TadG